MKLYSVLFNVTENNSLLESAEMWDNARNCWLPSQFHQMGVYLERESIYSIQVCNHVLMLAHGEGNLPGGASYLLWEIGGHTGKPWARQNTDTEAGGSWRQWHASPFWGGWAQGKCWPNTSAYRRDACLCQHFSTMVCSTLAGDALLYLTQSVLNPAGDFLAISVRFILCS